MSDHSHDSDAHGGSKASGSFGGIIGAIFCVIIIYIVLLGMGLPQKWTQQAISGHHDEDHHAATHEEGHQSGHHDESVTDGETVEAVETEETVTEEPAAEEETVTEEATAETEPTVKAEAEKKDEGNYPPYWMIAPFAILLLCIAILPLIPATEHWWESNRNRFLVAAVLGLITLLYYGFMSNFTIAGHWPAHFDVAPDATPIAKMGAIFINAIIGEYIAFIVLLFALFTITGGIRIEGDLKASPKTNSIILLIGALLASFVGTTGAAMLLIRLLLETNKQRKYKVHTIVFFIFAVCNCGGCLLPIGDPPLFLGYLRGVNFLWTFGLWKEWLFVNGLLVVVYFIIDSVWYYRKESAADLANDNENTQPLKITGLGLNLPLLLGVVLAVALLAPEKPLFGWHPPYFLREAVQLALCGVSLLFGSRAIRKANEFNFGAIAEVAALFFGIFICMQAPLQILNAKGDQLPVNTPVRFYWATGALSSVLDNAPTYVVFLETGKAQYDAKVRAGEIDPGTIAKNKKEVGIDMDPSLLVAISLGAVFMGSMTYIGNGPNFMVKAIAEQSGVKMPSFFGYMVYSILILIPIFIVMNILFIAPH